MQTIAAGFYATLNSPSKNSIRQKRQRPTRSIEIINRRLLKMRQIEANESRENGVYWCK